MHIPARLTLEEYFSRHVYRPLAEGMMRGLITCYQTANVIVESNFPSAIGREAHPHIKRGLVDEMMCFEAGKHPNHAQFSIVPNKSKSSVHTEVYCGPLVLTANYVPTPKEPVRSALHRTNLNITYNHPAQESLFGESVIPASTRLYAQIVHGCTRSDEKGKERNKPDFVIARFPFPQGLHVQPEWSLDLVHMFSDIFGRERSTDLGIVDDQADPKPRRRDDTGDAG